ncbi:MAG: glycosyltransferase family 1 protein [Pseudomonadota bacterium]
MNLTINATCLATDSATGIERFALHMCNELYRLDNTVDIVSFRPIPGLPSTNTHFILNAAKKWFGKNEYYVRAVWDQTVFRSHIHQCKSDVVYFPIQDGMLFPSVRQIVTIHDLHYLHFGEQIPECTSEIKPHRRILYRYKLPHILKTSAAIVAVSETTKRELVATFEVDPEKIHVIYNGYDDTRFRVLDDPQSLLDPYGLQVGTYLLFVGSVLKHKNIVRLLRACAKFDGEVKLVMTGSCKDCEYYKEIMTMIEELQMPSNSITYLDYVPDTDLPALYNGAMALVLPSLHEGFGVPIIEAMACGTPVITSNCSAMPEIAGGAALLVDPYSVESIAAAIQEIMLNPQCADQLRMAGFTRVEHFKWTNSARRLYELCKKVSML